MKPSKQEAIDKLIANLEGTAQNLDQLAPDYDLDPTDPEVTEAIDAAIFECSSCGWWFERSDESVSCPGSCHDCHPDDGSEGCD